jgi:hypothetical protein
MHWTEDKLKEFANDIYYADDYSVISKKYNISSAYAAVIASVNNFPHPKITAKHGGPRAGCGRGKKFESRGKQNDKENSDRAIFPRLWLIPPRSTNI